MSNNAVRFVITFNMLTHANTGQMRKELSCMKLLKKRYNQT